MEHSDDFAGDVDEFFMRAAQNAHDHRTDAPEPGAEVDLASSMESFALRHFTFPMC